MTTSNRRRKSVKRDPNKVRQSTEVACLADHLEAKADEFPTKGERTRCRFKAAAARILGEKGYHDLRMGDICDEVGLSHGAIYEYYANKKEIAVEVLDDLFAHAEQLMLAVEPTGDEFSRLHQVNLAWVRIFGENAGLMRSMRQASDGIEEFRQTYVNFNSRWYDRIAEHILRVVGSPPRAATAAKLLARALGGMADEVLHDVYIRRVPGVADFANSPDDLAKVISVLWYRLAYVANPPVDIKGKYGKIFDIVLEPDRQD